MQSALARKAPFAAQFQTPLRRQTRLSMRQLQASNIDCFRRHRRLRIQGQLRIAQIRFQGLLLAPDARPQRTAELRCKQTAIERARIDAAHRQIQRKLPRRISSLPLQTPASGKPEQQTVKLQTFALPIDLALQGLDRQPPFIPSPALPVKHGQMAAHARFAGFGSLVFEIRGNIEQSAGRIPGENRRIDTGELQLHGFERLCGKRRQQGVQFAGRRTDPGRSAITRHDLPLHRPLPERPVALQRQRKRLTERCALQCGLRLQRKRWQNRQRSIASQRQLPHLCLKISQAIPLPVAVKGKTHRLGHAQGILVGLAKQHPPNGNAANLRRHRQTQAIRGNNRLGRHDEEHPNAGHIDSFDGQMAAKQLAWRPVHRQLPNLDLLRSVVPTHRLRRPVAQQPPLRRIDLQAPGTCLRKQRAQHTQAALAPAEPAQASQRDQQRAKRNDAPTPARGNSGGKNSI